ncbi:hypothetical protein [Pantoea ananatis]|uniref:hypothetical protein n=1 Tax=Pantoea ananas TaxID=553 RepID=UPI0004139C9A|nr:hypothetical protein [Pantoea ananatis]CRH31930.1 Glyoxalase family protein [Pantoea ananatis]
MIGKIPAFYKGIGFKTQVTEQNPPLVFFNHAGTRLELYPLQNLAKDINESHPPALADGGFNGITFAINVKSEQVVDDLMALVQHHGGTRSSRHKKSTGAATAVIFAILMAITGRLPGHPSGSLTLETG